MSLGVVGKTHVCVVSSTHSSDLTELLRDVLLSVSPLVTQVVDPFATRSLTFPTPTRLLK